MSRRIVVTSGKGGVGKTTVTANLGLALARLGVGVVLVDADIGLNNLDVVMELESKVVYDLGDVLNSRCRLRQALIRDFRCDDLYLLPSSKICMDRITPMQFSSVISELASIFDYVLVDSPAGIDDGFHRAVLSCREALVVTTSHVSAVRDANTVMGLICAYEIAPVNIVVNRIRSDMVSRGVMMSPSDIAHLLKAPLIASLPDDDNISVNGVGDEISRSKTHKAYKNFALALSGTNSNNVRCENAKFNLFERIFGKRIK
ncbi:MAG: septum site-determining protein MinD [Christensenellaceae bacterium]|nr:septum site-determining protein MinD [Christensenellaceae bacterium]